MEYSEKYGKDVDEAVRLALDELGLREDQVMVTVLEEPSKGFLGLREKYAKVRVEKIEEAVIEDDISQADALAAEGKPQTKAKHDFRKKNRSQGQTQKSGQSSQERSEGRGEGRKSGGGNTRSGEKFDKDRGGRDSRDGRNRKRDRQKEQDAEIDLTGVEHISEPIENLVPDPENESAIFLQDVISKMGLTVQIEGFKNEECSFIEIKGQDSRIVIGKRGQTLDALQYLTNLVSNKDTDEYKRVIIDVEGYRSRREKTLEQLAVKLAKKVLSTGRTARLEPMNPYERKVIHATLQHVNGITTKSEGDEPYRRVIIKKK